MRRFLQCATALLLTAIWLPSMQHCILDAIGLIEAHVVHHDEHTGCTTHGEETQHAHDTCVLVEFSSWFNNAEQLSAQAPAHHDTVATISETIVPALNTLLLPSRPVPQFPSDPPDWIPSRHFAERAAPLSRAPSTLLA